MPVHREASSLQFLDAQFCQAPVLEASSGQNNLWFSNASRNLRHHLSYGVVELLRHIADVFRPIGKNGPDHRLPVADQWAIT